MNKYVSGISKVCDGGILVIGAGDISYKFARKSLEQLEKTGCKILGSVLNKVDVSGNSIIAACTT